jgi:FkbM family methyltransferase
LPEEIEMVREDGAGRFPSKEIILGGHSFKLHGIAADDGYFNQISPNLEMEFYALCRRLILPDWICLDVGANIGFKSLFLSRHCSLGRVIAIEPAPTVARCLKANIAANAATNVVIKQTAVGDTQGLVKFYEDSAWSHISSGGAEVPMTTLEEIVRRSSLTRVDFIKIDTEGSELFILRNSLDLINRFESLVLVELNSLAQLTFGINPRDFIDLILKNFSNVFALSRSGTHGDLLKPIKKNEGLALLQRNLVYDGCVTDLLVTNAERRLVPSPAYLEEQLEAITVKFGGLKAELSAAVAERDLARTERDEAKAECNNVRKSKSWRLTAPLRWLNDRLPMK